MSSVTMCPETDQRAGINTGTSTSIIEIYLKNFFNRNSMYISSQRHQLLVFLSSSMGLSRLLWKPGAPCSQIVTKQSHGRRCRTLLACEGVVGPRTPLFDMCFLLKIDNVHVVIPQLFSIITGSEVPRILFSGILCICM